ncbi:hypothetical protein GN958_ATG13039 [Phytophthora infestans]|uniref:Uncharacterized protein n=1 Tax=Phytophthora infestans TaxID=4787 RepID=A0A8S9UAF0_PHYIN|nr:hypothetical protein GN958_ATG13039 [Phytophthora infestans]
MSAEQEQILQTLEVSGVYNDHVSLSGNQPRRHSRPLRRVIGGVKTATFTTRSHTISDFLTETEATGSELKDERRSDSELAVTSRARSESLVREGLRLLFHCEYLTMVEYVKCIVPLVFVTYKSVLNQLPNAVYYPDGTDNLEIGAVTNILVFAALEIASLHLFLQRKLSLSPLYQLAFALETQVCLVQAALFVKILLLLQYDSSLLVSPVRN